MNRPVMPPDIDVHSPSAQADEATLYRNFAFLRRNMPVAWVDREPYRPFWAVVRSEDIKFVEKHHDAFLNAPRLTLLPKAIEDATLQKFGSRVGPVRTLLHMDPPDHTKYREITAGWLIGPGLRKLAPLIDTIADQFVQRMKDAGGECDFATDIAVWYPLEVITAVLGAPREDAPYILKMTQALLAQGDPTLQQDGDYGMKAFFEFSTYLGKMLEERRANPREDLTSVIANARVDGNPIGMIESLSYILLAITAGHDTTSAATAGGLYGFITHPGEMQKLRDNPKIMRNASNEISRWVAPVRHFVRTAARDVRVGDVTVAEGESVALFYQAGSRDETVYDEPDAFRIDRDNSGHVAFGFGIHSCAGRQLALLELDAFFSRLIPQLKSIELAGEPTVIASNVVGGFLHLPVRYSFH
jgi:cytochrome P450